MVGRPSMSRQMTASSSMTDTTRPSRAMSRYSQRPCCSARSTSFGLGQDHPLAIGGMHAAHPERRIGHPLFGRVSEKLLDLRADEVPATVLARLGDVDHARDALDDGPVLRLRHDELVAQAALAAEDPLAVDEQERLAREDRHGDAARRDGDATRASPSIIAGC